MNKSIKDYGYTEFYEKQLENFNINNNELIVGRVIERQRENFKIVTDFGESDAKLKGALFFNEQVYNEQPTVGDFVIVKHNPIGEDVIYKVFERQSKFSRMDSFNEVEQLVAVNFDYVCITTSLNYDFNIKRIERYLTIAWQSGATPIVILTKRDLCEDYCEKVLMVEQIAIGVKVIALSSVTGEGIDELKQIVKPGKTVVFLGSSGVGKSSLVNAIAGEEIMKVSEIRENDSKGRHTTTHRQLLMLSNGSMVIDTPGMREIQMWTALDGLDETFKNIINISKNCRFRDCSHEKEPGCSVRKALENGELSEEQWKSYIKLKKEIQYAEKKEKVRERKANKLSRKNRRC